MQVVYHLGAPCTDGDLLIKSLLKNRATLADTGIIVPPPGRYRPIVRDAARALQGRAAGQDMQEALLDAIVDEAEVNRLVLSDPRFICINRLVIQRAQIWPMIERQTTGLRGLFPDAQVTFCIGMRDPATLIPALFHASRFQDFREFTENMQPQAVAWSEMLRRLRMENPDCAITVWCNEDTPFLWGQIMRRIVGVPDDTELRGTDDLLQTIMVRQGFRRLLAYLRDNPPSSEPMRKKIVGAFLERYAMEDAVEEELDLPGWTQGLMAEMSEAYDADMQEIAAMPGVTLLHP